MFTTLPDDLGFDAPPRGGRCPLLALGGLLVALTIQYLPGTARPQARRGLQASRRRRRQSSCPASSRRVRHPRLGVVLGPEAPLIAIGSGLGVLAVHLVKKDAPARRPPW